MHSGRPNGVQKLIIFEHMLYFSGFPQSKIMLHSMTVSSRGEFLSEEDIQVVRDECEFGLPW